MSKVGQLVAAITLAALTGTGTALNAQGGADGGWKFLGRWKANYNRSDIKQARLTFTSGAAGDMTLDIQGLKNTFKVDGREYPGPLGTNATWTQPGPRTWRTVYKLAGEVNNVDTLTLSADEKTLTVVTEYFVPKRMQATAVYSRQTGSRGLAGVWASETVQFDSLEMELRARDARTIALNMISVGATADVPIDGRVVPMVGAPSAVAPSLTASLKVLDATTFELTFRDGSTAFMRARYSLSADGRSLSGAIVNAPESASPESVTIVFERQ